MRTAWLFSMKCILIAGSLMTPAGPAFAQWPLGTTNLGYWNAEQEAHLFLLKHYVSQPGKAVDLSSIEGLRRLPDLQAAINSPTTLKNRLGLGVRTSFSDPAIGRINYRWIPVFSTGSPPAPAGNVLPASISNLTPLSSLLPGAVDQALYLTHISDMKTCPVDPSEGGLDGSGSGLPQVLVTDPEFTDYAVLELKPDAERTDLWIPSAQWTAVRVDETGVTAVQVKPKSIPSKPTFTAQNYKAGPVSVPVGMNYAQNWIVPGLKRTVNHSLSFQINATQLNQSTLTYESRIPNLGKSRSTNVMALAIVQPIRQSALTGAAIQGRLDNGTSLNTFVGYETNQDNRAGHLVVQMTHTGKETQNRVTHTTGFVARLGSSSEATGLYQLRSGSVIASAAVTPVRFQDIQDTKQVSTGLNMGASFTNQHGNPVTGFVNVGLLKDWSKDSGISGEVSAGVVFPKTRTTMFIVVPLDYFANHEGTGPRAQFNIPLNRLPAAIPRN